MNTAEATVLFMALPADFCYFITCVTFLCDMIILPLSDPVHYSKSNFKISEENRLAHRKATSSNPCVADTVIISL